MRLGKLWIDVLSFREAMDELRALVTERAGGMVFTPNVDHVVLAERDAAFAAAYAAASLSLADGTPIIWASRLLRMPLPAKLSGSDLIAPVARLAAENGWGVYLLGGRPGAASEAARRLRVAHGTHVVGIDEGIVDLANDRTVEWAVERIRAASPDIVLVGLGAPKQELFSQRVRAAVAPAVMLSVGVSIDFTAGFVRRAPPWMSRAGVEWVYRLVQEPRRLWRRYLVDDPRFLSILARTAMLPPEARQIHAPRES
ncbi:MAG: hypothetical protein NVS9B3_01650 [Gemmatimonadaceae bacterium]